MEQPEEFEIKSDTEEKLFYKLNKSLYGLKKNSRNWNKMLHEHWSERGFLENPVDHCVKADKQKMKGGFLFFGLMFS